MRIAYVARWDVSHESGIAKKMADQLRSWRAAGHEATFFVLTPGDRLWEGVADLPVHPFHGDGLRSRALWRRRVWEPILASRPDVLYLRFSTWYPALERPMRLLPSVVEVNGDDVAENRLSLPRPLFWVHRATRHRLLQHGRGMVYVTRELAAREQFTRFGAEALVLGNGIALGSFAPLPAPANPRPRLLFVGYGDCAWHGLDKIARLARVFPEWRFDLVGVERLDGAPSNVALHGVLERARYQALAAAADAALGTLALHRKGMHEASPLKTREYLAYGIPTVIGYEDTDFPDGHPLLLRLPNTEDNVEAGRERIRAFVEGARGRRVPRVDVAHLDTTAKEGARLAFLERIAREGPK